MNLRSAIKAYIGLVILLVVISQHGLAAGAGRIKKRRVFAKHTHIVINDHFSKTRVIVKFRDGYKIRVRNRRIRALDDTDLSPLRSVFRQITGIRVRRLFERSEDELSSERDAAEQSLGEEIADPNLFFELVLPDTVSDWEIKNFIASLNSLKIVETAYLQPIAKDQSVDTPPQTPDYEVKQRYLGDAPNGINWLKIYSNRASYPGISGANVTVADVEYNWDLNHEDLNSPAFINGTLPVAGDNDDHGTAVLGILVAQHNGYGISGIVPDAGYGVISTNGRSAAASINSAVSYLSAGDVINISIGYFDSRGYSVPLEYYGAVFTAIQLAVAKGIIVVESAANGKNDGGDGDNLDDTFYKGLFNRAVRDSGAIVVAGAEMGALNHRYATLFTNYGSRIDCYAWGNNVTTTGYGELFNADSNQKYTESAWGTSFSAPIVAGVAAALESYYKQLTGNVLTPWQMRTLLTTTGTPASREEHYIGTMPNMQAALTLIQNTSGQIADSDHDGLFDSEEVSLGTNPNVMDTDNDNLADGDEVHFYHTDPKIPGAALIAPKNQGSNSLASNQFQWVEIYGENYYQLYIYDENSGRTLLNTMISGSSNCAYGVCSYTPTMSLQDGHKYIAWLYTYPVGSIPGSWSPQSEFTSWATAPTVPLMQTPVEAATVPWKPIFTWTSQPGATGYQVDVSDANGLKTNSYTYITPAEAGCANGQATCSFSYTNYNNSQTTGLLQGQYYWYVVARNQAGTTMSAYSQSMNVSLSTPAGVDPISPISSTTATNLPVLTWQSTPQANYYWLDVVDGTGVDSGYIYVPADLAGCANGETSCSWQPSGYGSANSPLPAVGTSQWCVWAANSGGMAPGVCANFVVQ